MAPNGICGDDPNDLVCSDQSDGLSRNVQHRFLHLLDKAQSVSEQYRLAGYEDTNLTLERAGVKDPTIGSSLISQCEV